MALYLFMKLSSKVMNSRLFSFHAIHQKTKAIVRHGMDSSMSASAVS
eukprot:CAMPEP_0202496718 /NCGR_PEP_ID=MMETSP1361-20130828/20748_1 /ASSEMBLY_ACC=CAM_ASM_000849 /TAXON_ID=210615 /ORGANISM="Staurosira complex sp., Strain CCMP2646" /LENGTH=46 /DNA_ID= /DNA_START= /DNA_END= /DNA_ORIENTATION=